MSLDQEPDDTLHRMSQHLFESRCTKCCHFQEQAHGSSPSPEWNVASRAPTTTFANLQTLCKINSKPLSNANNS